MKCKILFAALLLLIISASIALAGKINGQVTYGDGSPCSSCKVIAVISSGGVTDPVYTDSKGYFTLIWSSDNWIEKLIVKGQTVATDIKPGKKIKVTVD